MRKLVAIAVFAVFAIPVAGHADGMPACAVSDQAPSCTVIAAIDGHVGYALAGDIKVTITRDDVAVSTTCINGADAGDLYVGAVLSGDSIQLDSISATTVASVTVLPGDTGISDGGSGTPEDCPA
ncbi:MAG: hypothetical protein ABR548_12105 [Actinomycetota bacterium]|nr:hypothetical protein [Actinomycetota bacterium]